MLTRRALLAAAAAQKRPPNILLLLGDNWAYPHASAYGDQLVRTPVFDRLAREGTLFTHAFAPNPSCSPSRASLLTGRLTHQLGEAASLYGPLPLKEAPPYPARLEALGYVSGYSGKGWGPGTVPAGEPHPAGRVRAPLPAFLDQTAGRPFCYWLGSTDPHVPWTAGHADPARATVPPHLPDHPTVRRDIAAYGAEVMRFDSDCAAAVAELEKRGLLDNTLVIMTSDNGWQMPRGLAGCYDLGVRIPLVMRLPGVIAAGARRDDFVALSDLTAAFMGLAEGKTGEGILSATRRDEMFVERERHANVRRGDLSYPIRGLRTRDHLYLWNIEPDRWPAGDPEFYWAVGEYGDVDDSHTKRLLMQDKPQPAFDLCFAKRPAEELYDLRTDPGQVRNIAPRQKALCAEFRRRVVDWMRATNDPRAKDLHTSLWDRAPYSGPRGRQNHAATPNGKN